MTTNTAHAPLELALYLQSELGTVFFACGPADAVDALARRHRAATTATPMLGACCRSEPGPCAFDEHADPDDEDYVRATCLLAEALARAEGRDPRPFTDRFGIPHREQSGDETSWTMTTNT